MLFGKKLTTKKVKIGGMSCNHCKARVEKAFLDMKEVKSAEVDLENKLASLVLKKPIDEDIIKATVENLGFSFEGIEE